MRSKHFGLVLTAVSAAVLAAPALSEARSIPFFGKSACKEEKERLHHEEKILRDRQRLALDQCRAGSGAGRDRCEDLKRQQKEELKRLKDRGKRTVQDCKERAEKHESKGDKKGDKKKEEKSARKNKH